METKTKFFKVLIGYGADDFVSIDETELPMAIRAQITGKVGVFKEGTITGNRISAILPDFNKEMGYHRDYKMTGEDYDKLGRAIVNEYRILLSDTKIAIESQLGTVKQLN